MKLFCFTGKNVFDTGKKVTILQNTVYVDVPVIVTCFIFPKHFDILYMYFFQQNDCFKVAKGATLDPTIQG